MGCTSSSYTGTSKGGGGGGFLGFLKSAGSFIYHASGAADVVGCVTHPSWGGCLKAVGTVALTVGTLGEGAVYRTAIEATVGLAFRDTVRAAGERIAGSLASAGYRAADFVNPALPITGRLWGSPGRALYGLAQRSAFRYLSNPTTLATSQLEPTPGSVVTNLAEMVLHRYGV